MAADIHRRRLQAQVASFVRAFGLHLPDTTPCGEPVGVSAAHALTELELHGPLSQQQLAGRLRLEKSSVSRLVDQLVRRGWVVRDQAPATRRSVALTLTEGGREAAERVARARADRFEGIIENIPQEEREEVFRALDRLIDAAGERRK
ncbi:MAG TPA: MarR family winged helix-turn-helix transcriptional regulator [Chloroflexota bacterium]|nr:MarR family winged helix-turn-helix transcriptional regulator [Chloroflexota bacterium]